jgi:hypothetical protein
MTDFFEPEVLGLEGEDDVDPHGNSAADAEAKITLPRIAWMNRQLEFWVTRGYSRRRWRSGRRRRLVGERLTVNKRGYIVGASFLPHPGVPGTGLRRHDTPLSGIAVITRSCAHRDFSPRR